MTALEAILLAYCILFAAVIVIQTIRLELARDTIAERDAQLARREVLSTPRCKSLAQCVKTHDLAERSYWGRSAVPVEAVTPVTERQVRDALSEIYHPEGAVLWYDSPNPHLNAATPRQFVDAGDGWRVLQIIDALATGAHT